MRHPGPQVCPELELVWKKIVGRVITNYRPGEYFYSWVYYGEHEVKPWDQQRICLDGTFFVKDRNNTYCVPSLPIK